MSSRRSAGDQKTWTLVFGSAGVLLMKANCVIGPDVRSGAQQRLLKFVTASSSTSLGAVREAAPVPFARKLAKWSDSVADGPPSFGTDSKRKEASDDALGWRSL